MLDYAMERAIHGVTTIKMRLDGAFEIQMGTDTKQILKQLRLPPQRRTAKVAARLPKFTKKAVHAYIFVNL